MKEHEFNQMQQAFEESKFYQCGESQVDRIANWNVWKESWKAALSAAPAQEPVAYRVIASANGEVVRDSLEFTRMSEIDEKVVRKSYDLEIIPLFASQSQQQMPTGTNAHGLDARYFHGKLSLILRDIDSYKPTEMHSALSRLADVVSPLKAQPTINVLEALRDECAVISNDDNIKYNTSKTAARIREIDLTKYLQSQAKQEPVCDVTFSRFLSDVLTAAGLVSHGKQCKALGDRLGNYVVKYRTTSQAQQLSGNSAQLAAESFEHWKSTLDHRFFDEPSPITAPFNAGFELGYQAALSAVQENHIPEVGKMVQQPAQEPVKEATE